MALRLMTYNILDGGAGREDYILQVLQTVRPDVAVLQEVFHVGFVQDLANALNMEFFFAEGNSKRHLALLSRRPIVSPQSYRPFPPIHHAVLEAEIEYSPNKRFRLFGVHLVAWYSVLLELWRQWEIKVIVKRANLRDSQPCVILGDFNTIAPQDKLTVSAMPLYLRLMILSQGQRVFRFAIGEMLSAGFTDCFRVLHPDQDGFTLPPPVPNARLDYIFVNNPMKAYLQQCFVVREPSVVQEASDHYPVVADFQVE